MAGGILLGLACMIKMSPAVIVIWWLVRRKWPATLAAGVTAVITGLLSLALVNLEHQLYFYGEVLPAFFSSTYHHLSVPFNIPMNHSLLNFWMQITQSFGGMSLSSLPSTTAVLLAKATAISSLLLLLYLFRKHPRDKLGLINAAGAFVALTVVSTAYAFEHHLVFLLLPLVAATLAWRENHLPRHTIWILLSVYAVLAVDLRIFRGVSTLLGGGDQWSPAAVAFRELKFVAAAGLGVLCALAAIEKPRGQE